MQQQIYNAPHNKLKGGYYHCPEHTLRRHALVGIFRKVAVKYHKAQPACDGHCPMCKPAEKYLDKRVKYAAEHKQYNIFSYPAPRHFSPPKYKYTYIICAAGGTIRENLSCAFYPVFALFSLF